LNKPGASPLHLKKRGLAPAPPEYLCQDEAKF
jgi:hypothetical protein